MATLRTMNKSITIGLQTFNSLVPNHTAVGACSFMLIPIYIWILCSPLFFTHFIQIFRVIMTLPKVSKMEATSRDNEDECSYLVVRSLTCDWWILNCHGLALNLPHIPSTMTRKHMSDCKPHQCSLNRRRHSRCLSSSPK